MSYNLNNANTLGTVPLSFGTLPVKELQFYGEVEHRRLKVFYHKGTKCANPNCSKVGTKLLVNELTTKRGYKSIHVDIFTEDGHLMTVDHTIPKSKGGHKTCLTNLEPMCAHCNGVKSDKL